MSEKTTESKNDQPIDSNTPVVLSDADLVRVQGGGSKRVGDVPSERPDGRGTPQVIILNKLQ